MLSIVMLLIFMGQAVAEDSWTGSVNASLFYTSNAFNYDGIANEAFRIKALQIGETSGLTYYTSVNLNRSYTIVAAYDSAEDVGVQITFSQIQRYSGVTAIYDALDVDDEEDYLAFMALNSASSPVIYYINLSEKTYLSYTDGDRNWEESTWNIGNS